MYVINIVDSNQKSLNGIFSEFHLNSNTAWFPHLMQKSSHLSQILNSRKAHSLWGGIHPHHLLILTVLHIRNQIFIFIISPLLSPSSYLIIIKTKYSYWCLDLHKPLFPWPHALHAQYNKYHIKTRQDFLFKTETYNCCVYVHYNILMYSKKIPNNMILLPSFPSLFPFFSIFYILYT